MDDPDRILFFYQEGCPDCWIVKNELLPRFLEREGLGEDSVEHLDIEDPRVGRRLLDLEKELGFKAKVLAPILIRGREVYCGVEALRSALDGGPGAGIEKAGEGEGNQDR